MKRILTTYCLFVALFFYCGDLACYAADVDHACHLMTGAPSADEACGAPMDVAPDSFVMLPSVISVLVTQYFTAESIALQHPLPTDFVRWPDPHIGSLEPPRGPPALSMHTIL